MADPNDRNAAGLDSVEGDLGAGTPANVDVHKLGQADRWLLEVLGPGPGAGELGLVEDAAFHLYARGAVDYEP